MPVLDIIVQYCAVSPMAKHNGVAGCSRSLNVAWRRRHLRIMKDLLNEAIRGIARGEVQLIRTAGPTFPAAEYRNIAEGRSELYFYVGMLDDLEDIM